MKTQFFEWPLLFLLMSGAFQLSAQQSETNSIGQKSDLVPAGVIPIDNSVAQFEAVKAKAEKGNEDAQFEIGSIYEKEKNYIEAAKWYHKAADQGQIMAQFCLGGLNMFGNGMTEDHTEAAKWYRKAADQGYAIAQLTLGEMYLGGDGVPHNNVEAYKWITLCAAQDVRYSPTPTYCKDRLSSLESVMTPEQIAKARQLALEFKPRKAAKLDEPSAGGPTSLTPPVSPPFGANKSIKETRPYTEQQIREMLLTTPFFSLPKNVQDWYINGIRKKMKEQDFEVTDAEIIQEYYRKQQLARPPADTQQNFSNQQQIPVPPKSDSGSASHDSSPSASGTGFLITDDGYLISNNHVVKGATRIRLVTSAGTIDAKVVQVDAANDLALLKADGRFEPLPISSSRSAHLGGSVATIGFPDPTLQGFSPKLAKGEIASLSGAADDPRYFQISVPVQPGNSGGALVDERGNVIGIVSAKLDASVALAASGALPENVNYAVKSSLLLSFLESVPDVASKLKAPNTADEKFEDVVKSAQDAAVLVLVY
jgi:S1-C subfamily serine protease